MLDESNELLEFMKINQAAVPVIFLFPSFMLHPYCTRSYKSGPSE